MREDGQGRCVALFDMDGTLLPWDTQYVFSCFVLRLHPWRRLLMLFFLLCIPLYALKIWDENRMKRAYLIYLWGLPAGKVREYGQRFASLAQDWIYPELNKRLQEHRAKGDYCIMVSASPSFYVEPLAKLLGFDGALGTDVLLLPHMPAMPVLLHGNNKGCVKVERLRAQGVLPKCGVLESSIAYSDSAADIPMLCACRKRVLINPSRSLRQDKRLMDAECLYPPKPWKGKMDKIWNIFLFAAGLAKVDHKNQ